MVPPTECDRDAAGRVRPSKAALRDFNGMWWEPYYSHRTEGDGACVSCSEPWPCAADRSSASGERAL